MSELLKKLEEATESRLDLNIAVGQALGYIEPGDDPRKLIYIDGQGDRSSFGNCYPWPDWTSDTDAAIRLLVRALPGWHLMLMTSGAPPSAPEHCLWRVGMKGDYDFVSGRATSSITGPNCANPALAICAGIIKAKGIIG